MEIKDLKGTRVHKRLHKAYKKGEKIPELITRLSKEHDDRCPTPQWSTTWENTLIPVERVVAYGSQVLAPAETRYSATEQGALAAKESLIHPTLHRRGKGTSSNGPLCIDLGENIQECKLKTSCMGTCFCGLPRDGYHSQAWKSSFKCQPTVQTAKDT